MPEMSSQSQSRSLEIFRSRAWGGGFGNPLRAIKGSHDRLPRRTLRLELALRPHWIGIAGITYAIAVMISLPACFGARSVEAIKW